MSTPPRLAVPFLVIAALSLVAAASSCQSSQGRGKRSVDNSDATRAKATLTPKSGTDATGTVVFQEEPDGKLRVIADLSGLAPGAHGFHVHETGDCSAPDASSAGDHYAGRPTAERPRLGEAHGYPEEPVRHAGDLGNVLADREGKAHMDRIDDVLDLDEVIGRAIVVHAQGDDGESTKSAGGRVACGVIQRAPEG